MTMPANDPFSREGAESLVQTIRQAQRAMEEHPLSGVHINQGSADAMADAYEAEYQAGKATTAPSGAEYDAATAKVLADALDRTIARSSDRVKAACGYVETSGADVLTILDIAIASRSGTRITLHLTRAKQLRTAVAALIARNAELEAERDEAACLASDVVGSLRIIKDVVASIAAERDALAAEVKALRVAAKRLLDAYDDSAPEFECADAAEGVRNLVDAARASAATGGGNG